MKPDYLKILELMEYQFARTLANRINMEPKLSPEELLAQIRDTLWCYRLQVYGTAAMCGATLPIDLVRDDHNPRPGFQSVDQPTPEETP